ACKLGTDINFLGREAVEKARAEGPRRNLVSLVLEAGDVPHPARCALWGGELVLRDGKPAGQMMSGAWGEALGAYVGLAYVRHPEGAVVTPAYLRAATYQCNVAPAPPPPAPPPPPSLLPATPRARACAGGRLSCHTGLVPDFRHMPVSLCSPVTNIGDRSSSGRSSDVTISAFDLFKVGIGPSSSHTVGPMRAAGMFVASLADDGVGDRVAGIRAGLVGSLGAARRGPGGGQRV